MSKTIKITVTQELEACGIALACCFVADVEVTVHPPSGDGWNEPREQAYAEFLDVEQLSGPHIQAHLLSERANEWTERNQATILNRAADERVRF